MRTVHLFAVTILALSLSAPALTQARDKEVDALVKDLAVPEKVDAALGTLEGKGKRVVKDLKEVLEDGKQSPEVELKLIRLMVRLAEPGIEALAALLKSSSTARPVLENLGELPANPEVEVALVELFRDGKVTTTRLVILTWMEEKATRAVLVEMLIGQIGGSDLELRSRMAVALAVRGGAAVAPDLLEELRLAESNRSAANLDRRLGLIEALGWVANKYPSETGRILPTLVQCLGNAEEQKVAVESIIRVGGKASSALLMVLKAGDTARAAPAMEALLSIGREAAPEVVALLEARHPKIRELAQQFLCFYQDPAILPLLKALYKRSKAEERAPMLKIIGLYGTDDAWSVVMDAATDEDVNVRYEAVRILGTAKSTASVPVLLARAQEDAELKVRMAAIRSLYRRGERDAVPVFAKMVEYEKWDVRVAILDALAWIGGPGQVKVIAEQMRHRQSEVASSAERALWNITFMQGQKSPDDWIGEVDRRLASQSVEGAPALAVRTFQVAGTEVEYGEAGEGDVVLVLLPSGELPKVLLPKAYAMLALDHHVVLVAFPGCPGATRGTLPACMRKMAKKLEVLVSRVSPKAPVAVVAHGVTGYAALALFELNSRSISHLVWSNPIFPRRYFLELTWRRALERLDARWREEWKALEGRGGDFVPQAMNLFRSRIEAAASSSEGGGMFAEYFYGAGWLLQEVDLAYEDTVMEMALANVTIPTLLVVGDEDFIKDENVEAFRTFGRIHRNVVLAGVPGSVRLTPYEQPGVFAATVRRFVSGYKLLQGVAAVGTQRSTATLAMWDMGAAEPLAGGPVDPASNPDAGKEGQGTDTAGGTLVVVGPTNPLNPADPTANGGNVDPALPKDPTGPADPGGTKDPLQVAGDPNGGKDPTAGGDPALPKDPNAVDPVDPEVLDLTQMGSSGTPGGNGIVEIQSGPSNLDWLGWTLVGVGAVGLGAGAWFSMQAVGTADQANALDPFIPGYSSQFDSKYSDAQSQSLYSWIAYGVGALSVLAGLDILLGWPIPVGSDSQAAFALTATPLPGGGALVLQGNLP